VAPWAKANKRMQKYYAGILSSLAKEFGVSMGVPYRELPESFQHALMFGTGDRAVTLSWGDDARQAPVVKSFDGLITQLTNLYETTGSELARQRIRQYMSRRTCAACGGARLKPEVLSVTVKSANIPSDSIAHATDLRGWASRALSGDLNIHEFCRLTVGE